MKKPLIFSKEEIISVKNIARDICCSRQHVYNL